jgi:uncharacterized protein (TIGR04255 family)
MPDEHEVYPNAPLVLVTAELSYAHEPRLNTAEVRDVFAEEVRGTLPVLDVETVEPDGGDGTKRLRATNEERTVSAVVSAQALTVEATEYTHFDAFAKLLTVCFAGLERAVDAVYVERVGLRYIDEVRPPDIELTRDWAKWIAPKLVASAALLPGRPVVGLRGLAVYGVAERTAMVFQWGEWVGGSVVAPSSVVRKCVPDSGRFFVLDADAFWSPESPIATRPSELVSRFEDLHAPVSEVFQVSLTDSAKSLFRGGQDD